MRLILTSSPCVENKGDINPANGFTDMLKDVVGHNAKALYITATPDDVAMTRWAAFSLRENLEKLGMAFSDYFVLDGASAASASSVIMHSNFIILGGGHLPTQNFFFRQIELRRLLCKYQGTVMGISAGSMNCARIVYAQPEEPGESTNPCYRRFLPGLNLTHIQVLPHYNKTINQILDGKRLFEDITYADSIGHCFYALPDGSFIISDGSNAHLYGEAYRVKDSRISVIKDCHID